MADYYEILGVEHDALTDEIPTAFEALLASRRARRQKTSDLHAAFAVLADPALRAAYDAIVSGEGVPSCGATPKAMIGEAALLVRDAVADIDLGEVAAQALDLTLKTIVVVSGTTAKIADVTGLVSRRVQAAAAGRIIRTERGMSPIA